MSQELSDKIRAAAQAKNVDPDVALAIARAESSLSPAAQAKTSTAGGLFQVVDKTWKEFGGKPGKKLDADENIRVGTDIIAKNAQTLKSFLNRDPRPAELYAAHYFGPTGAKTFLSADPSTPIVDILGKAAVKANPNLQGKNVGQVLAQLETKMGGRPAAQNVSRETPEPAPAKALPPSLPPMAAAPMKEQVANLGPGYQAALALSFLADSDDKPERDVEKEPGIAEQWLAQQATRPSAMAQFADISIKSPFAEPQQPQMFNEGGEVESLGSKVLKAAVPMDLRMLGSTLFGNRDQITEKNFNADELAAMQQAVDRAAARTGRTEKGSVQYVDYPRGEEIGPGYQPVGQTLGRFTYERGPNGQMVITDKYDFYNEGRKANVEKYEKMGSVEKPLSVAKNMLKNLLKGDLRQIPGEVADAYIGREGRDVRIQLPVRRSDGGSAEPTPEEIAAASRPATMNPMIQRQGEAARRLAAMRDVNTLPDPRTYAAVSGFLGTAPDEMGFSALHPDREGIKRAGQAGFGVGTALQVAPVAGKAAQMLAKMSGSALNERMLAGQSLTPGINTPAPINFAVKPRGGHFAFEGKTYGGPREQGQRYVQADPNGGRVEVIQNYVNTYLANTSDQLLNEWMRNKVAPYMRRDMGTEMDQFVKAADEGRKLHFINKPITEGYTGPHMPSWIRNLRKAEGFPEEGFAKTPYGQDVEMITDKVPGPVALDEAYESSIPPGLKQFVKTDPNMRIYELNFHGLDALNLIELRDKMAKMRQMSPEFSKYAQPPVKVPEQYMFTDKSLQGLTPAQASERVVQFDAWKQEAQQKMASRAAFVDPAISRTPSSGGHVWVNPPDLERNPTLRELVQDIGCDGGWCTKGENYALNYGSGENRLTVLMDSKARPRAQMTINSKEYGPDDFIESLTGNEVAAFRAKYPDIAAYHTDKIAGTPEFQQFRARNPDSISITEIKGVNNEADLRNAPYVKQIQERVKQLDAANELTSVDNLEGIGMVMLPKNENELLTGGIGFADRAPLAKKFGLELAGLQAVRTEALRLNNWSQYLVGNEDDVVSLVRQATRNVLTPQQRAFGGMIERR